MRSCRIGGGIASGVEESYTFPAYTDTRLDAAYRASSSWASESLAAVPDPPSMPDMDVRRSAIDAYSVPDATGGAGVLMRPSLPAAPPP